MSHVFISYSRADYQRAQNVATALEGARIPLWWDPEITLGDSWEPAIQNAIYDAAAVVVLWSVNSIRSEWVWRESSLALDLGTLIQARIDRINPPEDFAQFEWADLSDWNPRSPHREFDFLQRHLLSLFGGGGAWSAELLDRETIFVTLDFDQHTVQYNQGHLYVNGELTRQGVATVITERSFDFELRDGGQYYPAWLVITTSMLGKVKRLTLSVGGKVIFDG